MFARRSLGARGEAAAARHLRQQGYRILARNLRTPLAELDLLARDGHVLVVVEVKTRRTGAGLQPPRGVLRQLGSWFWTRLRTGLWTGLRTGLGSCLGSCLGACPRHVRVAPHRPRLPRGNRPPPPHADAQPALPAPPPARVSRRQRRRLHAAAAWLARQPTFRTRLGAPCAFRLDFATVVLDGTHFVVTIRRDVMRRA